MANNRAFFDRYSVVAGAYNPDLSNFAILYMDVANGYYPTSVVGSISGDTLSWGTPQVVSSQHPGANCMAMNYDPQYDVYVGFFRYSTYQNRIRIALGSASGTSITWTAVGNAVFSQANGADYYGSCYNPTAQRHGLVYRDQNNGGAIKAAELTVTGTTSVSYNQSDNMWSSSGYNNCYICYDSTNDCYLVAASKQNNNWYGVVRLFKTDQLASPPGGEWSVGGAVKMYGIEHDPVSGNTCILYYNTGNGNVFLQSTATVNTTSGYITGGTAVQVNSGTESTFKGAGMTYDSNAKKFVITYSYSTGGTAARVATVNSAGVITLDPIMTMNVGIWSDPDNTISMINVFNSNVNKVATVYQDAPNNIGNGTYGGYGKAITAGSTNLDAAKYIGFSAESVTNGQTAGP